MTLNAAISLRAHCRLESREDGRVVLISEDTGERVDVEAPSALGTETLPLVARLVRFFDARGLTLTTRSDSPVGAGIAGSSAMNIALIAGLNEFTKRGLDNEAMLEIAKNVEARSSMSRPACRITALCGGIGRGAGVTGVRRCRFPPTALASRIVLAYARASRNSGINNWDMMKRHRRDPPSSRHSTTSRRSPAHARRAGASGWDGVGRELAAEWDNRKRRRRA